MESEEAFTCRRGQHLVRVRAQVMTRDDSSGGWVPLGGGGLSNVSVRKRTPDKNEYLIYGKRISDQSAVLSCTIKKDFEYNIVMPTFHHWKTGEKKFGLTFQTAADARAFDKGVRMVIEDLLDGSGNNYLYRLRNYHTDIGDDDVFMTLDLPVERDSTSSGSSSATGSHHQIHQYPSHLHRMYFGSRSTAKDSGGGSGGGGGSLGGGKEMYSMSSKEKDKVTDLMCCEREEEPYSPYVQFRQFACERPHEYSYPIVQPDSSSSSHHHTQSLSKLNDLRISNSSSVTCQQPKKPVQLDPLSLQPPPLLPTKSSGSSKKKRTCGKKRRCRDCHEVYYEDSNPRGSCPAGPDSVQKVIDGVSCMCIARGCLYHCYADSEGHVPPNDLNEERCSGRWLALALLSIIFPCMCLYLPLAGCHRLGRSCSVCGAKHHPS